MFDRGAPCKDYRGKTTAKVTRERYGCRSRCGGAHLAGSSENIRPVVAFAESYPIPLFHCGTFSVVAFRGCLFSSVNNFLKEVKIK